MKKIINSIAAALLAATTAGAAQQDVQEAGIVWNFVYDGDAFPSEDEPIRFTLDRHSEEPVEEAAKDEAGATVLRQTTTIRRLGETPSSDGRHPPCRTCCRSRASFPSRRIPSSLCHLYRRLFSARP
jgi:hypothetical protein